MPANPDRWPELPADAWRETRATLHLMTQIVGKIRLALTPWQNHSWHVPLYVSTRGLTTSPIPDRGRTFQIDFDFLDHVLWIRTSDGHYRQVMLRPVPVAEFYDETMSALEQLGIEVAIRTTPNEIVDAIPFDKDKVHASYDADYVRRFWHVLVSSDEVFKRFRTGFLGKVSPVHFFWGSFDLASRAFPGAARRRVRAGCRTCRTLSRARPIRMKCRAPASGRAAAASTTRPRSTPTPIPARTALPKRASRRRKRAGRRRSANSSCLMRRCARATIPTRR